LVQAVGEAQRPLVLGGRLPVRGQPGRLPRGGRRVTQHRRRRHGRLGVERQPGVVGAPICASAARTWPWIARARWAGTDCATAIRAISCRKPQARRCRR
jgi:hypothetical protein